MSLYGKEIQKARLVPPGSPNVEMEKNGAEFRDSFPLYNSKGHDGAKLAPPAYPSCPVVQTRDPNQPALQAAYEPDADNHDYGLGPSTWSKPGDEPGNSNKGPGV